VGEGKCGEGKNMEVKVGKDFAVLKIPLKALSWTLANFETDQHPCSRIMVCDG